MLQRRIYFWTAVALATAGLVTLWAPGAMLPAADALPARGFWAGLFTPLLVLALNTVGGPLYRKPDGSGSPLLSPPLHFPRAARVAGFATLFLLGAFGFAVVLYRSAPVDARGSTLGIVTGVLGLAFVGYLLERLRR